MNNHQPTLDSFITAEPPYTDRRHAEQWLHVFHQLFHSTELWQFTPSNEVLGATQIVYQTKTLKECFLTDSLQVILEEVPSENGKIELQKSSLPFLQTSGFSCGNNPYRFNVLSIYSCLWISFQLPHTFPTSCFSGKVEYSRSAQSGAQWNNCFTVPINPAFQWALRTLSIHQAEPCGLLWSSWTQVLPPFLSCGWVPRP